MEDLAEVKLLTVIVNCFFEKTPVMLSRYCPLIFTPVPDLNVGACPPAVFYPRPAVAVLPPEGGLKSANHQNPLLGELVPNGVREGRGGILCSEHRAQGVLNQFPSLEGAGVGK
jgi:hypothetical protein